MELRVTSSILHYLARSSWYTDGIVNIGRQKDLIMATVKVVGSYEDYTGEQYCMPSWNERNTMEANKALGYNNLSDKANRDKMPTGLHGEKSRKQIMGGDFGY